ncbi:MAG: flagellar biosynthetic protein FliO [Desulfobaccales bacterium]
MSGFWYWLPLFFLAAGGNGAASLPPPAPPDFPFWHFFGKIIAILSAMVGVLFLALGLWKRLAPKFQQHPAPIRILATQYLAPKQALFLVAVGQETFLLASSANNLSVIPLMTGKTITMAEALPPPQV